MTGAASDKDGTSMTPRARGDLFKAYDIRGIVPNELPPETAYQIGRATVAYLRAGEVAVGRDMRLSGPALSAALIDGIRDQGADAVDLGLVSTDALYFTVGKYGYPAGVMITASHNPAAYNGFKICREEARALSLDEGIGQIRDLVLSGSFPEPTDGRCGSLRQRDILDAYAGHVLNLVDTAKIRPLKVAIDAGNGMAGAIIPRIFRSLPIEIIPLYFELDGTFPNHDANPIEPENIKDLQRTVMQERCDLGVAFDGDADRMFLIDERGQFIGGDMTTAMVSVATSDAVASSTPRSTRRRVTCSTHDANAVSAALLRISERWAVSRATVATGHPSRQPLASSRSASSSAQAPKASSGESEIFKP